MRMSALERAMQVLEVNKATNAELRKSMILAPSPRKWWEKEVVEYAFGHPHIRNRLEKLMGSNIVRITDRRYMQKLQERIYEEHLEQQRRRMKEREIQEVDREKRLILSGRLPFSAASKELYCHPVLKVTRMSQKIIKEKRKKVIPKMAEYKSVFHILAEEEGEDLAGSELQAVSGLTPSKYKARISGATDATSTQIAPDDDEDDDEDNPTEKEAEDVVKEGLMFTQEEYDKLRYELPQVKELRRIETVDEMYKLADEIIGVLRTMKSGHVASNEKKPKGDSDELSILNDGESLSIAEGHEGQEGEEGEEGLEGAEGQAEPPPPPPQG